MALSSASTRTCAEATGCQYDDRLDPTPTRLITRRSEEGDPARMDLPLLTPVPILGVPADALQAMRGHRTVQVQMGVGLSPPAHLCSAG
jgi:hypothetical protein